MWPTSCTAQDIFAALMILPFSTLTFSVRHAFDCRPVVYQGSASRSVKMQGGDKKNRTRTPTQTNAPFPSTSHESNHQVEAEEPPSNKKKLKRRNKASKKCEENKRLWEKEKN